MKFKIVYVSGFNDKKKPIFENVGFFSAESYDKATEFIEEYNKNHTDRKYYWANGSMDFGILNEDGSVSLYDQNEMSYMNATVDDFVGSRIYPLKKKLRSILKIIKKRGRETNRERVEKARLIRRIVWYRWLFSHRIVKLGIYIWSILKDKIEWWGWGKWKVLFNEWRHEHRRVKYFKENHHDIQEYWSLDEHMLDDLRWNLGILVEKAHGIPNNFIVDALKNRHGDDPEFDVDKWMVEHNHRLDDDIEKDAIELRNKTYNEIIHKIDLYRFFSGNLDDGICQTPDMENVIRPGSYDVIDYGKMYEIAQKHWKSIWEFVIKYGQGMWD